MTEVVFVSGDGVLDAVHSSASGVAAFALPPGDYAVEVAGRTVSTRVDAWATTWVELAVEG